MPLGELNQRRWNNFKRNKRGYWSLWVFGIIFFVSLFAEIIANDKPVVARYDGGLYFPALFTYAETVFGGEFESVADYTDPYIQDLINEKGGMIWPPIRYSHDTIDFALDSSPPTPPSTIHWLGTDDQGRDILACLLYTSDAADE